MNSRRTRLGSALAVILTVLVLVPTAVLFGRVWTDNADQREQAELEKKGVEFLTALSPLVSSLAESESTGIQGVTDPPDSLKAAVAKVTDVDNRLGDDLKTRERWADLQQKIGKLATLKGATTIYAAHVEVTDLILELYVTVRRNAELNRDPDSDISNLQEATAVDMPTTVVRVNRMGDQANLLQAAKGAAATNLRIQFGQEVLAVQESVNKLTNNLQAAVDNTSSPTLSGSLVSSLDSFRRGVESMTRGASLTNVNVATMSTAQSTLQTALSTLSGITLKEMDRLLDDRLDSLNYRRTEAVIMGLLAILLVLGAIAWPAISRRRDQGEPAAAVPPTGEPVRDIALNSPGPVPGYASNPYGQIPAYGEVDPTQRERSGALR
ncbi:hypothetical protein Ade02nite_39250 [Paractinoplanes deccanensis]|uniref:Uncharacterized protein n=1 Tax=Paractinoplanes deccanensis TaxID=113561 RepID=A0ABQ3Y5L6_9ACTN|nr:hypothetical protein Ade02nite_39250 [Actinoplanes deccanensis]